MKEFRCTRPGLYQAEGCPGKTDTGARQGHYVSACSEEHAVSVTKSKFPGERIDVQDWNKDVPSVCEWCNEGS